MEQLLGQIKTLIYIGGPIVAIVSGYVGLKWLVKATDTRIDTLEKEYIKELNDVDDKLERAFGSIEKGNAVREGLKKEYLTKREYELMEESRSYKVKDHVSKEVGKLKQDIDKTMTDFTEKFGNMFDDMKKTIKSNGKV